MEEVESNRNKHEIPELPSEDNGGLRHSDVPFAKTPTKNTPDSQVPNSQVPDNTGQDKAAQDKAKDKGAPTSDSALQASVTPPKAVPFRYLPAKSEPKPGVPTVVMVDDFRIDEMPVNGDYGFSHGELSSRIAEENGFNVVRVQVGLDTPGGRNIEKTLKGIGDDIDSGKLDLGKDDIINVSLGLETTFQDATKLFGFEISADNLRDNREKILEAIEEKSHDKSLGKRTRAWLNRISAINDEITSLQDRGVDVATAAGNKGPDHFNIGMLASKYHFSALDANGSQAHYSGWNSLTTPFRGDINLYAKAINVFDPKPFDYQTGSYRLDGTNIYLDAKEFGGLLEPARLSPKAMRYLSNPTANYYEENLTMPNHDAWRGGTLYFSERGTSFVNGFALKKILNQKH